MFHAWYTFIDKEENFTWEYFSYSVRNSFLTQVAFRAKINKFRLIIFIPPSQKSFCNNFFIVNINYNERILQMKKKN
jgi:hypothetical protein